MTSLKKTVTNGFYNLLSYCTGFKKLHLTICRVLILIAAFFIGTDFLSENFFLSLSINLPEHQLTPQEISSTTFAMNSPDLTPQDVSSMSGNLNNAIEGAVEDRLELVKELDEKKEILAAMEAEKPDIVEDDNPEYEALKQDVRGLRDRIDNLVDEEIKAENDLKEVDPNYVPLGERDEAAAAEAAAEAKQDPVSEPGKSSGVNSKKGN